MQALIDKYKTKFDKLFNKLTRELLIAHEVEPGIDGSGGSNMLENDHALQQRIKYVIRIAGNQPTTAEEIITLVCQGRLPTRLEKGNINRNLSLLHQHKILERHSPDEFEDRKPRFVVIE